MKTHWTVPAVPNRPEPLSSLAQLHVSIMGTEVGLDELAEFQTRLHLGPSVLSEPLGFPSRTQGR